MTVTAYTAAEYHADPAEIPSLSASIAHILYTRSPLHAWHAHPRLNPDYQPVVHEKFDVGTVVHALLLEQRDPTEVIFAVDAKDWRTKAAQEQRDEARAAGLIPLLTSQIVDVSAMLGAVRAQLDALTIEPAPFTMGHPEQCVMWEDDGVHCRALIDWLHYDHATVDDLKTTSASASPFAWPRAMFSMGKDMQARWYQRGIKALTGTEPEFRFVVAETSPPYALTVFSLSPAAAAIADAKIDSALATWKRCLETGRWPGYAQDVHFAEAPPWAEAEFLAREEQA